MFCSYAEWYQPPPDWSQPAVMTDTTAGVEDLLNLKSPQPTADVGSLCSVAILTSPFASLNWAKIPCDYPIFRAGLMCKKPAVSATSSGTFLTSLDESLLFCSFGLRFVRGLIASGADGPIRKGIPHKKTLAIPVLKTDLLLFR